MISVALTIAGSDPSGGAGIQADLKTFQRFHVFGTSAVTLVTAQNTMGVSRLEVLSPTLVTAQISAVLEDLPVSAAKTGALGDAAVVAAVAQAALDFRFPLVVDPVMISKHGTALMASDACRPLIDRLLPVAALVTPNLAEAAALTGQPVADRAGMESAARVLLTMGCKAVLIKGGHLAEEPADFFASATTGEWLEGKRVTTRHTHGTGCTYSAAVTALLAAGSELLPAVRNAKQFVQHAIETAPGLGSGHGPLNHWAGER